MPIDLLIKLIPSENRWIWNDYLQFVACGMRRFNYEKNKTELKIEKLRLSEKALHRNYGKLSELSENFKKNALSLSLLTDWLTVWRYTATLPPPLNEKQISDIIGDASSLLARMIMALNDENPTIYLPLCSLLSAVIFLYLTFNKDEFIKTGKWSSKQRHSKLKGWLKNSGVLLSVIRSKRLKFQTALLLNILKFYARNLQNNKQLEMTFLDEIRIFMYSTWQFITIRRKSVTTRGI